MVLLIAPSWLRRLVRRLWLVGLSDAPDPELEARLDQIERRSD